MDFNPIINYLTQVIANENLVSSTQNAEKVNKGIEAILVDSFERYITGRDGDVITDYFKIADGDIIMAYNGVSYERIDDMGLRQIIKGAMDKMGIGLVYRKYSQDKIAHECFESMCWNPNCRFEPNRRYMVFKNCVYDIETDRVYAHGHNYKTDVVFDFDLDKDALSPLWNRFIIETIPDVGMREAFQKFCGAMLVDRSKYKIEFVCLLLGSGNNGKSVLCDAIKGIFGDKLVSAYSPEQLFKSSQAMYHLADVNGKVANFCDDVSNKDFSGGDFKLFVSGAKFEARHPYGRPFTVTKVPLLFLNMNEMPPTTDDSKGHFRRLLPIMCPNQVADDKIDVELPNKLSRPEVKSAIFNWLVEGYHMLLQDGGKIKVPDSIREIKENIKDNSNSCRRWIKDSGFIKVEPTGVDDPRWKSFKEIMANYMDYCKAYSEQSKSPKSVAIIFKDLGFPMRRSGNGVFYCLDTKSDFEPEDTGSGIFGRDMDDSLPF